MAASLNFWLSVVARTFTMPPLVVGCTTPIALTVAIVSSSTDQPNSASAMSVLVAVNACAVSVIGAVLGNDPELGETSTRLASAPGPLGAMTIGVATVSGEPTATVLTRAVPE